MFDVDEYSGLCSRRGDFFQVEQRSCKLIDDGFICQIALVLETGWVKGLIHISGPTAAVARFEEDRKVRSDQVFAAFKKYYCRWRPRTPFIFSM